MQAGRLLDIKACGMSGVTLVLGQTHAQPSMIYAHLHLSSLNCLCRALSGDSKRAAGFTPQRGSAALRAERLEPAGVASGDRQEATRHDRTACPPSVWRLSTNVE